MAHCCIYDFCCDETQVGLIEGSEKSASVNSAANIKQKKLITSTAQRLFFFFCPPAMIFHHFPLPLCRFCCPIKENVITLSSYTSPTDRGCDKLKRCKIRIAQYLCNSMQIRPDASDVLCSPDGEESGRRVPRKLTVKTAASE